MLKPGKTWEEYTKQDQIELLKHWFLHFGEQPTFEEIEKFNNLTITNREDILNYIITSFAHYNTIQTNFLIYCMRNNKVEELFRVLKSNNELSLKGEQIVKKIITDKIAKTYNNPETSTSMDVVVSVSKN